MSLNLFTTKTAGRMTKSVPVCLLEKARENTVLMKAVTMRSYAVGMAPLAKVTPSYPDFSKNTAALTS